jgi:hypothetical protein
MYYGSATKVKGKFVPVLFFKTEHYAIEGMLGEWR